MTLKTSMAADLAGVFLNTNDFAEAARYVPKGGNASFALTVVIGDPQPGLVQIGGGVEDRRPVSIVASRSLLRAGMLSVITIERDPIRGDKIVVDSGENAGTYLIESANPDIGGGITMNAAIATVYAPGGKEAREIR